MKNTTARMMTSMALAAALAGCGGGDGAAGAGGTPPTSVGPGGAAGNLTLSASTPALNDGIIDVGTATTSGNNTRAADGFSALPYCEVFFENSLSGNGAKYSLQVYFRQSDQAVLNASIVAPGTGWVVFDNNSGTPITGVTVNLAAKTVTFASKVLNGTAAAVSTANGTLTFPANATTAACGS
jgi:hypothetical protein